MSETSSSPLVRYLRERMADLRIGQKELAARAGLGDTYVRDILVGRSASPQVGKLRKLADVLGVPVARLLTLATASEAAELIEDTTELILLRAFRELPYAERQGVLRFIEFRLAELTRPQAVREAQ